MVENLKCYLGLYFQIYSSKMRTILISGASRGIGLNIAHKELKEGNRISVGIRDLESLKGSAIDPKKWPEGKIIINHYDALKKITAENWIKNTVDEFGGLDSVINCSGELSKVPFLYKDGDEEDILNQVFNKWELLSELAGVLGLKVNLNQEKTKNNTELDTNNIEELIKNRTLAKANKDFLLADKIRADLKNIGVDLIDKPKGVTEWKQLSD